MKIKNYSGILLALALICGLFCIHASAADSAVTEEDTPLISYEDLDNETAVFTFLTSEMGLNPAAACGVLANMQYESGFDPDIWGDSGTSYGLCQWHNDRCSRLMSFCTEYGLDASTVYAQMSYLSYELQTFYPAVWEYLQNVEDSASGAYDAAWYWCYYFEIPADRDGQAALRGSLAADTYYPAYAAAGSPDMGSDSDSEPSPPPVPKHKHA